MKGIYETRYYKAVNDKGDIIIFNDTTNDVLRFYKDTNRTFHVENIMSVEKYYDNLVEQGWDIDIVEQV